MNLFWVKILFMIVVVCILAGWAFSRREGLLKFIEEVKFEMTKVTWPPVEEVINSTALIGIVTIALGLLCLVTDTVFTAILKAFYR